MPQPKERTTRLPTTHPHENWWGDEHAASQRLIIETEAMRQLFRPGKTLRVEYADRQSAFPTGHDHFFIDTTALRLRRTADQNREFCWDINFRISGPGLGMFKSYPHEMKIYYPRGYPAREPYIAIIDKRTQTSLPGGWHSFIAESEQYQRICETDHTDNHLTGHDPARTTASQHALRALRWLRVKHYGRHPDPEPDY